MSTEPANAIAPCRIANAQKEYSSYEEAVEQAAVVVIGGPLIQAVPVVGGWFGMLPSFPIGTVVTISLPSIVAGAVAVLGYNLIRAMMK